MHPILFRIGPLIVHSYGVLLIIGFLIGLYRAMAVSRRRMLSEPEGSPRRIHPDTVFDAGIVGLIVGLIGARVLFVALDWSNYSSHPLDALKVWEGGLSLHGGMLFGILYFMFFSWRRKISLYALGDLGAVSWAIAYAVGRIGCLLNGCCYGAPTSLPWGVRFPDEQHPGFFTSPSHPTQIYASLFNVFFFLVLVQWEKLRRPDGELFYAYIGMYGVYRFIVDIFRAGATSTYIPGTHLTDTYLVSLGMLIISLTGIVLLRRHRPAVKDASGPVELPTSNSTLPKAGQGSR